MIEIYTDGGYNPALDQGGWAAVVVYGKQKHIFSGVVKNTTGNRMEVTAALEGLLQTAPEAVVTIYTDSQYLFGAMVRGWQRRANLDLWEKLDSAVERRQVQWQWLESEAENEYHREAHQVATAGSGAPEKKEKLPAPEAVPAEPVAKLTHVDETGRPRMVDVTAKADTEREAIARGTVRMKPETLELIKNGLMPKGDVLSVAQIAGILAAKQTPHLIPLCHPLLLTDIRVELEIDEAGSAVNITATVKTTGKTGVEMEALTATAASALTVYDMCKAVDKGMKIDNIRLVKKSGGKSGTIILEGPGKTT